MAIPKKVQPKSVRIETKSDIKEFASKNKENLPFTKMNYILLGAGVAAIMLGFFLMRGPFVDSKTFSLPLHVAPILVVGGFVEIIFAIMYKPRQEATATGE